MKYGNGADAGLNESIKLRCSSDQSKIRNLAIHSPQRRDRGDVYRNKRYRDGRDNAEPCRCIGIFGMSLTTTERDLSKIFGEFGDIEQVKVIRDHFTGKSRGFGFIYFSRTREAGKIPYIYIYIA
uniref:RRM domain-containing protein n=1 Tax=Heterorhabditis bacteriophora TaxID=37862 RepID=A0A1I7XUK6_HETBA